MKNNHYANTKPEQADVVTLIASKVNTKAKSKTL